MIRAVVMVLPIAVLACGDEPVAIPDTCNGRVELCDRRFDEVAYATTHNAMSTEDDGWVNPNQYRSIARQLEDGVRALMLDVHSWDDDIYLCHGVCQLGNQRLVDGLQVIADFLRSHRGEVVTLIFESYVTADDMQLGFADSGLLELVYEPVAGQPWPTLRAMIDADQRLVVLTDSDGDAYPWYVDVWAHAWETHYAARDIDDFSCDPNRGNAGNPLFIFNHFLTRTRPVPEEADTVNANPLLIDRARDCMSQSGSLPNFVTVDFYSVGDLFEAVDSLNGL